MYKLLDAYVPIYQPLNLPAVKMMRRPRAFSPVRFRRQSRVLLQMVQAVRV